MAGAGLGLRSLCRLRAGDGPVLAVIWKWNGAGGPEKQGLVGLPTPPLHRRKPRPRAGWGPDPGHLGKDQSGKVPLPGSVSFLQGIALY